MRQQRKTIDASKRTANDIFIEAKRRFQYKPGPSRKPHVQDIVGKSLKSEVKDSREKSFQSKPLNIHTDNRKSKDKFNKQNKQTAKVESIDRVKKMMKDVIQQNKERNDKSLFSGSEKKIQLRLDEQSSKELDSKQKISHEMKKPQQKQQEQHLSFSRERMKPLSDIRNYHHSKLFPKRRQFKSTNQSRNVSMELKPHPQTNNRSYYNSRKQNLLKQTLPTKSKENSSIIYPPPDHNRHLSSIQILQVYEPPVQLPSESPISFNFTELDIQVESVKEPEESDSLFKSYESRNLSKSKKYKYDTEEESKSQSIMSLSPVKNYSFEREEKLFDIEDKKRKLSVELVKGVKQTIIEEEEDKSSYSRILDIKCNQIFDTLDNKHIGIINYRNYENHDLHPQIKSLINPIISKVEQQSKSYTKKQFLIEIKRIMLSMRQKQLQNLSKCPILKINKKQARSISKTLRTDSSYQKTLPLKQITRAPYMRLNTRNSIGSIQLSKLSNQDSLQISSQSIHQPANPPQQFISDRNKQEQRPAQKSHPLYSLRRSVESELDASRIDALNQRLSTYIQRNNIQQNRYMSNQINLEFHELKKHLGFS